MSSKSKAKVNFSGVLELDNEDWDALKSILFLAKRGEAIDINSKPARVLYDLMEAAEEEEE